MECPLCFEVFNDKLKKPRNLDCGHTFCEQCLNKLYTNNTIVCPSCRRPSNNMPKALAVNFIAADLARKYMEERKMFVFCDDHPKEMVRFFCNTCCISICVECIVNHCGHVFVKQEESVKLVQTKLIEYDNKIAKIHERNQISKMKVTEIVSSLDVQFQKGCLTIEQEYNILIEELVRRKEKIKDIFKEMTEFQLGQVQESVIRLEQREVELMSEKAKIAERFENLEKITDGDPAVRTFQIFLSEIKETIETLSIDPSPHFLPPILTPMFEMNKNAMEFIAGLGKISCSAGQENEIKEPTICFFGDKNKVMAYKIHENSWEMRLIEAKYEFNYYAAAATLPDGSTMITGGGSSNTVYVYKDKKIYPAAPMLQIRKEHATVYLNNFVYTIGGYDGQNNQFLNECEKFCIYSKEWAPCASMIVARCAFSATSVNNKYIFIFGGYDGTQRLASIERFNPELDSWSMINTTLRFQLSNCGCFSPYINKVIVLGGGFSSGFSHAVEMLDIESLEWTSLSFMSEGRDLRNKITYFNGDAFCVGGYNFRAEKFQVEDDKWIQLPNYLVSDNLDSWSSSLTFQLCRKSGF
ncbi:hypothetical protein SteCoe_3044 [Stentor coeruleus]|uniref:RING-type domain-containing protein n=1 Tax=Stentor coeruleus TaxID=5963 RepID=A0A1R2CXW5_9CILI|nr:hypothetical protein SteCoe_3044 [Stentor coeruleus]